MLPLLRKGGSGACASAGGFAHSALLIAGNAGAQSNQQDPGTGQQGAPEPPWIRCVRAPRAAP